MRWLLYFVVFNLVLMIVVLATLWATTDLFTGGHAIGIHGWVAMALGVSVTSALGVVLMGLVFYSNRSHHDTDAHGSDPWRK